MKILITAAGSEMSSDVDERFGRAPFFIIFDTTTSAVSVKKNDANSAASHGAGIKTAQSAIKTGAEVVIARNIGPKAAELLQSAKVKMYIVSNGTVKEAVDKFVRGELQEA